MKNKVIAGDYYGWEVVQSSRLLGSPRFYLTNMFKREEFSKATVARYEVINKNSSSFFRKTYFISIELNNGKKALLEVDEKMYKEILRVLY